MRVLFLAHSTATFMDLLGSWPGPATSLAEASSNSAPSSVVNKWGGRCVRPVAVGVMENMGMHACISACIVQWVLASDATAFDVCRQRRL